MIPEWLHWLSVGAVLLGFLCAWVLIVDIGRRPQHMGIMNVVWPVTALFGGPFAVWAYFRWGLLATHGKAKAAMKRDRPPPNKRLTPFPVMVGKGATHCGSGCTLGDIVAHWLTWAVPVVAVWAGWRWAFTEKIFAVFVVDYIFAFLFGVAFQYFTIKPMRDLSPGQGLIQAVKADFLSLTAWQIGMYAFLAFAHFYIFKSVLNHELNVASFEFWFMMQIAMWFGFATSYPVNWWLLSKGIKEKM